ncbi:MAG: vWA domain-containing protein [Phycisphaeraceae bacterium]
MDVSKLKDAELRGFALLTHDSRIRAACFDELRRRGGPELTELAGPKRSLLTACIWLQFAETDPVDAATSLAVLAEGARLSAADQEEIRKAWTEHLNDASLTTILCVLARARKWALVTGIGAAKPQVFLAAAGFLSRTRTDDDRITSAGMLMQALPESGMTRELIAVGRRLLRAKTESARAKAIDALVQLGWKPILRTARRVIDRGNINLAPSALRAIGLFGSECDVPRLFAYVQRFEHHRPLLAETMDKLAPGATLSLLRNAMTRGRGDDQSEALKELIKRMPKEKIIRMVLNLMPGLRGDSFAGHAYKLVREDSNLTDQAIDAALRGKSAELLKLAVDDIGQEPAPSRDERLKDLLAWGGGILPALWERPPVGKTGFLPKQKDVHHRSRAAGLAFLRLADTLPLEEAADLARMQLRSPAPAMRHAGLHWFAKDRHHFLEINELLPLVRDDTEPVAAAALSLLSRYDDPRRQGEMASLIVQQQHGGDTKIGSRHLRAVARAFQSSIDEETVKDIVGRIEGTLAWAKDAGRLLLGREVEVKILRNAMGRARPCRKGEMPMIEISDRPIAHRHPHGEEIVRALALHEFGHHAFDFGQPGQSTISGLIRKDGLFSIYNALLDERLERKLRQKNGAWGPMLDRLLSYAFMQEPVRIDAKDYAEAVDRREKELVEAVQRGELPGKLVSKTYELPRIELRQIELLRIPGLVPPFTAFLIGMRCGLGTSMQTDERVIHALNAVPGNIKDLNHRQLLILTRKIGRILGGRKAARQAHERMKQLINRHRWLNRMLGSLLRKLEERGLTSEVDPPESAGPVEGGTHDPGEKHRTRRKKTGGGGGSPLSQRNEDPTTNFKKLNLVWNPQYDAEAHQEVLAKVRPNAMRFQASLQRLALRDTDDVGVRIGRHVDLAAVRHLQTKPWNTDLMVGIKRQYTLDAYIGLIIDRSGSMRGKRMDAARAFGTLVSEAAGRLPGVEGHVATFDGNDYTVTGDLRRNGIAKVEAGGDNNDAGAIWQGVQLARRSRKRNRLIVMVNDDEPTGSSVAAIRHVVREAQREDIICAQVMVAPCTGESSFPHAIDVAKLDFPQAVEQFTRLLLKLTSKWRSAHQ